jgi:hypothetical protein
MNDYTYEIEYVDGYIEELTFPAANLVMANELLGEYFDDCNIDEKEVRVITVEVTCYDEEAQ